MAARLTGLASLAFVGLMLVAAFTDHRAAALEAAVAALPVGGAAKVDVQQCDVTAAQDVEALVSRCSDVFGGVDILFNNAGVVRPARVAKMTDADFDAVVDVSLRGAWAGIRAGPASPSRSYRPLSTQRSI